MVGLVPTIYELGLQLEDGGILEPSPRMTDERS
jgi:hypothetical protein